MSKRKKSEQVVLIVRAPNDGTTIEGWIHKLEMTGLGLHLEELMLPESWEGLLLASEKRPR
jgi:hypothetical protein